MKWPRLRSSRKRSKTGARMKNMKKAPWVSRRRVCRSIIARSAYERIDEEIAGHGICQSRHADEQQGGMHGEEVQHQGYQGIGRTIAAEQQDDCIQQDQQD